MTSTNPRGLPRTRVPRAEESVGRLRIERGLDGARITTDPGLGDLLHGWWTWEPKVEAEDGVITLRYPRLRLARRWGTDEITLNASVPWDISVHGSVHRVVADLRGLKLRSLDIDRAASRLALILGAPDGDVEINVRSADRLTLRRPENTEVRVRVAKGATEVLVDDQSYGAIGGETILTTGPVVRNAYYLNLVGARRVRVARL